jgi:transcriptional regulator with XRE-family HTH domain
MARLNTADAQHVGARIRYWRKRRNGMTRAVSAGLAGVSQSYVSLVESGSKSIERRSTLVDIAASLQVSVGACWRPRCRRSGLDRDEARTLGDPEDGIGFRPQTHPPVWTG